MGSAVAERSYDVPDDVPEVSSGLISSVPERLSCSNNDQRGKPETETIEDLETISVESVKSGAANYNRESTRTAVNEGSTQPTPAESQLEEKLTDPEISVASTAVSESGPIGFTSKLISSKRDSVQPGQAPVGPPGLPPGLPIRPQSNFAEANEEVKFPPGMSPVKHNGVSHVSAGPPGLSQPPGFTGPPGMGGTEQHTRDGNKKSNNNKVC